MYGQKKCRRHACDNVIHGRCLAEHRRRKYCSHRCNVLANAIRHRRGMYDYILRRDCREVQAALAVIGPPPIALVRALRKIRKRSYAAGWNVVQRKLQRAIKRGVLIHRRPGMAA